MLGDIIKQKRKELGLTQEELADKIGMSRYAVLKYEKGTVSDIPINTRIAIADALQLSLDTVLNEYEYQLYLNSWKEVQEDYTVLLHKSKLPDDVFITLFRLEEGETADNFIIHHKSEFTPENFAQLKQFINIMKKSSPENKVDSGRNPRHSTYTNDYSNLINSSNQPPKDE